jgi:hypothetical protein
MSGLAGPGSSKPRGVGSELHAPLDLTKASLGGASNLLDSGSAYQLIDHLLASGHKKIRVGPQHFEQLFREATTIAQRNNCEVYQIDMSSTAPQSAENYGNIIAAPNPQNKPRLFFHTNVNRGQLGMLQLGRGHANKLGRGRLKDVLITTFEDGKVPGHVSASNYDTAFQSLPLNQIVYGGILQEITTLATQYIASTVPKQLFINVWGESGVGKSTMLRELTRVFQDKGYVSSDCLCEELWDRSYTPFKNRKSTPNVLCLHEADKLGEEDIKKLASKSSLKVVILETHQERPGDFVNFNLIS